MYGFPWKPTWAHPWSSVMTSMMFGLSGSGGASEQPPAKQRNAATHAILSFHFDPSTATVYSGHEPNSTWPDRPDRGADGSPRSLTSARRPTLPAGRRALRQKRRTRELGRKSVIFSGCVSVAPILCGPCLGCALPAWRHALTPVRFGQDQPGARSQNQPNGPLTGSG